MREEHGTRYTLGRCFRQWIQTKRGYSGNTGEILIQGEENRAVFQSDCGDQRIHGRQGNSFRPCQTKYRGRFAIRGETLRIKNVPHGKVMLDAIRISREPLQNFRHDDAGESKRLGFLNHPPQFLAGAAGRRIEKINPDGSVHQNQARFPRIRPRSPFQIPLQ